MAVQVNWKEQPWFGARKHALKLDEEISNPALVDKLNEVIVDCERPMLRLARSWFELVASVKDEDRQILLAHTLAFSGALLDENGKLRPKGIEFLYEFGRLPTEMEIMIVERLEQGLCDLYQSGVTLERVASTIWELIMSPEYGIEECVFAAAVLFSLPMLPYREKQSLGPRKDHSEEFELDRVAQIYYQQIWELAIAATGNNVHDLAETIREVMPTVSELDRPMVMAIVLDRLHHQNMVARNSLLDKVDEILDRRTRNMDTRDMPTTPSGIVVVSGPAAQRPIRLFL